MKTEGQVQADIREYLGSRQIRVFRNNVGVADGKDGRPVRFGIANDSAALNKRIKSSDLIGWTPNGFFLSIECKREAWKMDTTARTQAQKRWIDLVREGGGIAGFAASVADVEQLLITGRNRHD